MAHVVDDKPVIIIEKSSGGGLGGFLLGALVGAGAALLFAPQTGEETREVLREYRAADSQPFFAHFSFHIFFHIIRFHFF